jgi:hypothetical protein
MQYVHYHNCIEVPCLMIFLRCQIVDLLIRFLEQNVGTLPNNRRIKEFNKLNDKEVKQIEEKYHDIFKG